MNRLPKCKRLLVIASVLVGLVAGCRNTADSAPLDEALAHYYADRDQQGLEAVEAVLKADADNARALALRALFKLRTDDSESAHQDTTRALELDPDEAVAHCALSWYLSDYQDDVNGALAAVDRAIELDPELAIAYSVRGFLYQYMLDDIDSGLDDYQRALDLEPGYIAVLTNLGFAHLEMENYRAAIKTCSQAIEQDDTRAEFYLCRGSAYLWSGKYDSAISDLTRVIELGIEEADVYANRAWAHLALDDTAAAIADYERALTLDPENADAHNNAAYLIAQSDGDLEKALEYVNRALELMPGAESKRDTKGYILYKMGEYDEALDIFSGLIADGHTFSHYGRGLVYEALGETENAISDFQAFLQEYPSRDPESADARERIESLGG